jgi:hypothetical protein
LTAFGIAATAVVLLVSSAFDIKLGLPAFLTGVVTALLVLTGVIDNLGVLLADLVGGSATAAAWLAGWSRLAERRRPSDRALPVQETGITVRVKAIPSLYRMRIGGQHPLSAGKGRHQHQQRGPGEMKIRHQPVDRLEAIAGKDEQRRLGVERPDCPVRQSGAFQQTQAGGAHRDHPAAIAPRLVDGGGGLWGDFAAFRVHTMVGDLFHPHGQEGADTDMPRDRDPLDPGGFQLHQQTWGEMQPGGWCRHRALAGGEYGLVIGCLDGSPGQAGRWRWNCVLIGLLIVERRLTVGIQALGAHH